MRKYLLPVALFALNVAAQAPVDVPYAQTFDTESTLKGFITIDANNDEVTWDYNPMLHCAKCSWSNDAPVDDYLLLPINLEAYSSYELEFNCYGGFFSDTFDLWLADAPSVEGMKVQLMKPTDVKNIGSNYVHRVNFKVEQSGVYYIAWHDISAPDEGTIFLDNISIKGTASTSPAAPTFDSVVPAERGGHECDLTFTMPTTTLTGKALDEITAARIYRNDNLVATIKKDAEGNVLKPGALCTWHDKELGNRLYTYKVTAVSASGEESAPAVSEVYVGLDIPGRVRNLRCREDINNPGKVLLTWDAPDKGVHGGYLDPKSISYRVSKSYYDEPTVYETHYEDYVNTSGGQVGIAYSVYAQNYVGDNRSDWQTISTHVGPAMHAPWGESFPNASCKNGPWLTHVTDDTEVGDASWYGSSPVGGIPAQDGDNGYTYFFTSAFGKSARFTSPKVDISSLTSPALTFWLYEKGNADIVEVGVMPDMTEWETLKTITLDSNDGWKRFVVDLSDYKGSQFIQVGFNGISMEETRYITAVDNISIHNEAEYDLAVLKYDFPVRVDVGKENKFTISVRNRGSKSLTKGSYTVELYRRDNTSEEAQLVCTVDGPALDTDAACEVALTDIPGVFTPNTVTYSAKIVLEGDASPEDNIIEEQTTTVFKPVYPVPEQLCGESQEDGLALTWLAPGINEGSALPVTDSFEDYPIFSITDCGEWTLYDGDKQRTVIMALGTGETISLLQYENAGKPMAWQVFSPIDAGVPYSSWDPHSGELMMVAMSNSKNEEDGTYHDNDDWLISPALSGHAQSISFFAKCGMSSAYQPELLEVLYSTTDNDPASFTPALPAPIELYNVSGWEEHVVELPEGAKHFALRCVSQHKFALLLDDVTYQPAGTADLTLKGYNIYRYHQLLNDSPLPTPTYYDMNVTDGEVYEYNVTAIYDKGESRPSETYSTTYDASAGIDKVSAGEVSIKYYDILGRRTTAGSNGVIVSDKRKKVIQ